MNIQDQRQKEALVSSLLKAREKAASTHTYLVVNDRDPEEINAARLALGHIDIALEHIGATADAFV
ncbi:hypothetical protein [Mycobacterium tuberculosis]|uniref:hypothetical protein n=1 Tax=Mycobacterium tuberculosis TaxID=1773 RepID=UPI000995CD03|nr:hypothetical protein [Mycobacterium tuberculosis]